MPRYLTVRSPCSRSTRQDGSGGGEEEGYREREKQELEWKKNFLPKCFRAIFLVRSHEYVVVSAFQ
jgi:hypothetical protein